MKNRDFKIIDCFTFFNELDILRLRIKILEDHVDHFAIVEARQTHTGLPKKCLLNQDSAPDIFNHPKVTIKTIDLPGSLSNWGRERYQRDSAGDLVRQLSTRGEDIILLSDVDEIPAPQAIYTAISELTKRINTLCVFEQRLFYFRINYELVYSNKLPWLGTTAIQSMNFTSMSCMRTTGRNLRGRKYRKFFNKYLKREPISAGGWHFSYAGQDESLKIKLQSFAHQEKQAQESKSANINEIITKRKSLFTHRTAHEVWATIPLEDLQIPEFLIDELRRSPLVEPKPHTPAFDIVNDVLLKSKITLLRLGKFELNLRLRQ